MFKQLIDAICFRLVNGPLGGPASPRFEISKLDIRAGDFLILKFEQHLPSSAVERLRASLKDLLPPDVKILVFDGGVEISVLSPAAVIGIAA